MIKNILFLGFLFFSFSIFTMVLRPKEHNSIIFKELCQDNTVLIKKIKAKITALKQKREKLKALRKWTPAKEKTYQKQLKRHAINLEKLGDKPNENLAIDQIIKKLQRQLKYLNNARVNKNTKEGISQQYDSMYKHDAGILLDSIMKLRRSKEE